LKINILNYFGTLVPKLKTYFGMIVPELQIEHELNEFNRFKRVFFFA